MSVTNTIACDIIDGAALLLSEEERWTKLTWARTKDGHPISYSSPRATCWCLGGALHLATEEMSPLGFGYREVYHGMIKVLNARECSARDGWSPTGFSDHVARSSQDILDLLVEVRARFEGS